jgi:uncharacterized protein YndB with AHSA1/START domain
MKPDKSLAEVRRHFAASPERVFAAFAGPQWVSRWLTPSPEVALTVLQFDFYIGGTYRFAYRVPDGQTMIVSGSYRSIEPPTKIVFSWIIEPPDEHAGIESEVTVTITPVGGGTELHVRHEKLERADAVARHTEGWRGALDQLSTLFAAQGLPHGR